MRTEEEIRKEYEHLDEMDTIHIRNLLGDAELRVLSDKEADEFLAKAIALGKIEDEPSKVFNKTPEEREAYITGLMWGRRQALEWVLGKSNDLYDNFDDD